MKRIHTLLQLSWQDQVLLAHATLGLAFVVLGLRVLPWLTLQRHLLKLANWSSGFAATQRPSAQQIAWAIKIASLCVPNATCLPRAIAAQLLLVRCAYPADLQIGVAKNKDGKLEAHAWVTSENGIIIGNVHDLDHFVPLSPAAGQGMAEYFRSFLSHLRPEAKLLLCSARTQLDAANSERIAALLHQNIDWGYLLQMAFRHNVGPLLYRNLETIAPTAMPETIRAELKQQVQVNIQGNLFLTKELVHLLALFEQQGIPALPYKGPVLAASLYGNLALRPTNDLDILVHERDILQAMDLLVSCGYQIVRPTNVSQTEKKLRSHRINQLVEKSLWAYQLVLWHPERQGIVELHWRITPKYVFPNGPEELWEDLKTVTLGGVDMLSFAPENLLWFLCVHGAKHQWKRLSWLCDVAELIRVYPGLNWERVIAQATKLGIERRLYLGLLLANCMLTSPLPNTIETKIHATSHVKDLARQVMERAFDDSEQTAPFLDLERFTFQLAAIDRIADRGRYLLRFANGIEMAAKAERAWVKPPSFLSL